MTEQQMKEALEKATKALTYLAGDAATGGQWHMKSYAETQLSEISSILNPPRYVVEEITIEGCEPYRWRIVDMHTLGYRWPEGDYVPQGHSAYVTREDADHYVRLLNQEEERDGD